MLKPSLLHRLSLSLCVALVATASRAEELVSFSNDIQPLLTKFGCNQGACHGSQYGKGGFKLSLRGFGRFTRFPRAPLGIIRLSTRLEHLRMVRDLWYRVASVP